MIDREPCLFFITAPRLTDNRIMMV
eukprot:SAG31_NODE_38854_length_292_cov_6.590674_1_plen_24_part_01